MRLNKVSYRVRPWTFLRRNPCPPTRLCATPAIEERMRLFPHFASAGRITRLSTDPNKGMAGRCVQAVMDVLEGNYGGDPAAMPYVVNKEAFKKELNPDSSGANSCGIGVPPVGVASGFSPALVALSSARRGWEVGFVGHPAFSVAAGLSRHFPLCKGCGTRAGSAEPGVWFCGLVCRERFRGTWRAARRP